jgi:hypothetical protein
MSVGACETIYMQHYSNMAEVLKTVNHAVAYNLLRWLYIVHRWFGLFAIAELLGQFFMVSRLATASSFFF